MIGSLFISGLNWLWPASGFLAVALLLLIWGYRSVPATPRVRLSCAFLKLLGFLALAVSFATSVLVFDANTLAAR